ncbi:hypothetical protein KJ756_02180 [Patescibacteria group bacterium]|nr:hypothetical protein [Patescibacteria group bacterium]
MKLEEKIKAVALRKRGKSYKEILKQVAVSKASLSIWLRDIELTSKQKDKLYTRLRQRNAYKGAKANQRKRIEKTKLIIKNARKEAKLFFRSPLFLSGLMLYWAEGTKRGEQINFCNSDPQMIKFMMKWFREICKIPETKFRIKLYIHQLHCRKEIEKYWSIITRIPLSQFQKTYIKPTSLKHRKNILYDGTCAIRINDKDLFRKMKGWKLGVLKQFRI